MAKVTRARRSNTARKRKRIRRIADSLAGGKPEGRTLAANVGRESLEDPLHDWHDDDMEADRWLLERTGEDVQRGEG